MVLYGQKQGDVKIEKSPSGIQSPELDEPVEARRDYPDDTDFETKTAAAPEVEYDVKDDADEDVDLSPPQYELISFFDVQHAINSLIDYLNQSIEEIILSFSKSDQKLFSHEQKKLIMNAVLESGFYDYCKEKLKFLVVENQENSFSEEEIEEIMDELQEEIQLLAYILVNNRLVHRNLNFDLYLSLLKGGLFADIITFNVVLMNSIRENRDDDNDDEGLLPKKHKKVNVKGNYSFYI